MRRFLTLVCLLTLAIPAGVSFSGCTRNPGANYCNGNGYGAKITDLASLTLEPATTGVSMAYGQTHSMSSPSGSTCQGTSATVGTVTWGTTNNKLVDISTSGNICAGTWNRNSGGGIADYTICSPPDPLPSTGGLPYTTAYVTASAKSVTSNPVEIFVHAQVTSVNLVTNPLTGVSGQQCYSQGTQATLDAEACYVGDNTQYELCAPSSVVASGNYACKGGLASGVTSVPNCTSAIGTFSYSVGSGSIASVSTDTTTNLVTITAAQPGTTSITASVAGVGSSAGYFTTCPPKHISVALADGTTAGTITKGVTQNLVTTITDTKDKVITGLSLDYQSTDPIDISVGTSGAIATSFPGVASIYAICQPSTCNPAPINQIGLFGTGLPVSSNKVTITTPGTSSDYVWFGAPGKSRYIVPVELLTGTVGSTVRLPYVPNSMVMDRMGNSLYFGSAHELMQVTVTSGAVTNEDTSIPGVVLAVSPNGSHVLVNDQVRQVFYITGTTTTTYGGMGAAAAWTPDSKTLYITDSASLGTGHSDTLYVFDDNTGWTTCTAGSSCAGSFNGAKSVALTIPSVGAFLSGSPTVSRTWCPTGTAGDYSSMSFYPQGDSVNAQTDVLAATTDGKHILGAALTGSGVTLSDIGVDVSPAECSLSSPISTGPSIEATLPVTVNAAVADTAINQLVTSSQSNLAFLTYSNSGTTTDATLPYYVPGSGTVSYVTLTGNSAITAPLAGAFTPDDKYFFLSTAGDNKIHYITIPTEVNSSTPPTDSQQISPNLPACTPVSDAGCTLTTTTTDPVPATVIVVKPRSTT
jgi:sugar lactone lactonase YvrE